MKPKLHIIVPLHSNGCAAIYQGREAIGLLLLKLAFTLVKKLLAYFQQIAAEHLTLHKFVLYSYSMTLPLQGMEV